MIFELNNINKLNEMYATEISKVEQAEWIACEDECGCSGDCGSNWMRS